MIKSFGGDFLDLLFPADNLCPFCGSKVKNAAPICARCRKEVNDLRENIHCEICGRFFELPGNKKALCSECSNRQWPFQAVRSVGPHRGLLKQAVQQLKYSGRQALAASLGVLMAEVAVAEARYVDIKCIIPVPLSPQRHRQRGFNQAGLLAREIAKVLGVPVDDVALQKRIDTLPQAGLHRLERDKNLHGAFIVKDNRHITGQGVMVVDDVFTTGSTMAAVTAELLKSGASFVLGLTVTSGVRLEKPASYSNR